MNRTADQCILTGGQIVEKHAFGGFFNELAPFAYEPSARRAANGDRNPLLRKGSETAVHAAGFGKPSEGCAPPIPPRGCQHTDRRSVHTDRRFASLFRFHQVTDGIMEGYISRTEGVVVQLVCRDPLQIIVFDGLRLSGGNGGGV